MRLEALPLQKQCILYLLFHADEFPPSYLGLLPRRLRRDLLDCMSIADVCRLEGTPFTDGISTKEIWMQVYNEIITKMQGFPLIAPYNYFWKIAQKHEQGYRESCYELISFLILHQIWPYNRVSVTQLLFSPRICSNADMIAPPCKANRNMTGAKLIQTVMTLFGSPPNGLYIYCDFFRHTRFWHNDHSEILQVFLCNVTCCTFANQDDIVVAYFLELLLSYKKQNLQSVCFVL